MADADHSRIQHFIGMSHALATCPTDLCTGGNSLEHAAHDKVYEHVKAQGGHTVITKVRPLPFRCAVLTAP
jgi:hypothetical protein